MDIMDKAIISDKKKIYKKRYITLNFLLQFWLSLQGTICDGLIPRAIDLILGMLPWPLYKY